MANQGPCSDSASQGLVLFIMVINLMIMHNVPEHGYAHHWAVIIITLFTVNSISESPTWLGCWAWGSKIMLSKRQHFQLLYALSSVRPLIMWWPVWRRSLVILVTTKFVRRYRPSTQSISGRFLSATLRLEMSKFYTLSEDYSLSKLCWHLVLHEVCIEFHLVLWDIPVSVVVLQLYVVLHRNWLAFICKCGYSEVCHHYVHIMYLCIMNLSELGSMPNLKSHWYHCMWSHCFLFELWEMLDLCIYSHGIVDRDFSE